MSLRDRFKRSRTRRPESQRERRRTPSFREMRARMRTEKAEADLLATEARIHQEAARMRHGLP
jgi:hypothetical protein